MTKHAALIHMRAALSDHARGFRSTDETLTLIWSLSLEASEPFSPEEVTKPTHESQDFPENLLAALRAL